jgi:hypothetical protein
MAIATVAQHADMQGHRAKKSTRVSGESRKRRAR